MRYASLLNIEALIQATSLFRICRECDAQPALLRHLKFMEAMTMEIFDVINPSGYPAVRPTAGAKRLDKLDGMVIGELWNGDFKGDVTFPIIRALLKERYPSVRIVPFTEFPHTHVSDNPTKQRERAVLLASLVKEKGCNAVMSGNGA